MMVLPSYQTIYLICIGLKLLASNFECCLAFDLKVKLHVIFVLKKVPAVICAEPNLTDVVRNEFEEKEEEQIRIKFGIEDDDDDEEEEVSGEKILQSNRRSLTGLEKLVYEIFDINSYNRLVRPVDKKTGLTEILTELKLLQIDLVRISINEFEKKFFFLIQIFQG